MCAKRGVARETLAAREKISWSTLGGALCCDVVQTGLREVQGGIEVSWCLKRQIGVELHEDDIQVCGETSNIREFVACLSDDVYFKGGNIHEIGKQHDDLRRLRAKFEYGMEFHLNPKTCSMLLTLGSSLMQTTHQRLACLDTKLSWEQRLH